MLGSRISIIEHKNTYLSVPHANKNYLIGFPDSKMAYLVRATLPRPLSPPIELKRRHYVDVTQEVNLSLLKMNIPIQSSSPSGEVVIDPEARLTFPKSQSFGALDGAHDISISIDIPENTDTEEYEVRHMPLERFMMFPFEKNLGIVMPYDLVHADDDKYIFTANLVEPSGNARMFLQGLNGL